MTKSKKLKSYPGCGKLKEAFEKSYNTSTSAVESVNH